MRSFTAAFLSLSASALAQSSGSFNVLSFNVAGLPAILNNNDVPGDKTTNAKLIGQKLKAGGDGVSYDVVHMQEDFNYHSYIYAGATFAYRTATSGGVPFGSGLNTVANYPWTGLDRVKWDKCYINQGDCLTPKGFTFMRMQIAPGVEIDFYNLHADAGDEKADHDARASNFAQVGSYVAAHSADRPVMIFGDTNDRYTTADESINSLRDGAGLRDAWVDLINGGVTPTKGTTANPCTSNPSPILTCEVVDKVLYRGNSSVKLTATSFEYAGKRFLQPDGNVLSDHDPLLVNIEWELV
ncbi:hypothetical protein K461DRAFT_291864 [Myriangium duriaei CBS 260.36]|uniref:Inositol polyphosphate-related phosphatase domain-containing protein n=1 Tax=Myriangium duriaei CBS 260.36 TaxID=1168546 RepID=A0A9P4J7R3_9PEZI|nr:hypothetical protein K461DRAFT_291864 [Myriangium duriaei CBS 260.36]